ncbi:MAG: germination protein YpeB [Clostridia bacterium]
MKDTRKFQTVILFAVPVVLSLALAAVCIWASESNKNVQQQCANLENEVQSAYRQAVYQLSDNINDLQTSLKKLQVTGSTSQHILLLSDVWRLSGAAVANMGNIPSSHVDTADLNAFIVRTGDYARVLCRRILDGGVLVSDDYQQLNQLYEASVGIGNELKVRLDNDDFPSASLDMDGYFTGSEMGEDAQKDEESIPDYPTLIYDGPFSESNEKPNPKGIGSDEVDESKAKEIAIQYLGGGQLESSGLEEGTIPVFGFFGTNKDGRNVEITVTKQGGAVLWMMAETPIGTSGKPDEATGKKLSDAGKSYLDAHGYANMEATYAQFYDGIAVLNFAATEHQIILYADLVKVYVEQSSGAIVGIDATNYLMCHSPRTLPMPTITEEDARATVSEALEIKSVRLALIPKTASTEVLCYEVKGTSQQTDFIVYIDATTGSEQEIFEIINSEEGQLVV